MKSDQLVEALRAALDEKKALKMEVLDLRGRSAIADYFIVASGTSNRHLLTMAEEVDRVAHLHKVSVLGIEGTQEARWVLIDLVDVVVHLFLDEVRAFYDLEKLWSPQAMLLEEKRRKVVRVDGVTRHAEG